jgi:hypothetical protein
MPNPTVSRRKGVKGKSRAWTLAQGYNDKLTLQEPRTGLIESAGIECFVLSCKFDVQIVRRWE